MKILSSQIVRVFLWKIQFLLILLFSLMFLFMDKMKPDMFLVIITLVSGFNYLGLLLSTTISDSDMVADGVKQLLTENRNSGSPISIDPTLDNLTKLMKDAEPLLDQMTKNASQSKHYKNQRNNNNKKQILT